jgi:hypothetical protein
VRLATTTLTERVGALALEMRRNRLGHVCENEMLGTKEGSSIAPPSELQICVSPWEVSPMRLAIGRHHHRTGEAVCVSKRRGPGGGEFFRRSGQGSSAAAPQLCYIFILRGVRARFQMVSMRQGALGDPLMRTIGAISDTHGLLRPQALAALAGCDPHHPCRGCWQP